MFRDITIQQFKSLQFDICEKPILRPFHGSFVVADPSLLTPTNSPDGLWHIFFHTTFGIFHHASEDGFHFHKIQKICNRAMRPNINKIGDTYYLFFEHTRPLIANALNLFNLAKWKSQIYVCDSKDLFHWNKSRLVIGHSKDFEASARGISLSNPFLLKLNNTYRLYYSCGLTYIDDCGFCEPTYINYAESTNIDKDYIINDCPIISPNPNNDYLNLCSGCLKVYPLADGYIGIQNGIYKKDEHSYSAIIMLTSYDGLHFDFAKKLIEPNASDDSSWMHQYVYASHLVRHENIIRLYFNARDTSNMIKGRECIGYAEANLY